MAVDYSLLRQAMAQQLAIQKQRGDSLAALGSSVGSAVGTLAGGSYAENKATRLEAAAERAETEAEDAEEGFLTDPSDDNKTFLAKARKNAEAARRRADSFQTERKERVQRFQVVRDKQTREEESRRRISKFLRDFSLGDDGKLPPVDVFTEIMDTPEGRQVVAGTINTYQVRERVNTGIMANNIISGWHGSQPANSPGDSFYFESGTSSGNEYQRLFETPRRSIRGLGREALDISTDREADDAISLWGYRYNG